MNKTLEHVKKLLGDYAVAVGCDDDDDPLPAQSRLLAYIARIIRERDQALAKLADIEKRGYL